MRTHISKMLNIDAGEVAESPSWIGDKNKTRFGIRKLMWNPWADYS